MNTTSAFLARAVKKTEQKIDLSEQESCEIAEIFFQGNFEESLAAALLAALARKGESVSEITDFARVMRKKSVRVHCEHPHLIDTCGTGGSGLKRFNTSTTVAFLLASLGVPVAKHGNRAASGRCGSFDLLEGLGLRLELNAKEVAESLRKFNLGFMFAPLYHPAMKFIAPVRKKLNFQTIFNLLGPLTNPAQVKRQIIGTPTPEIGAKLIEVLRLLDHQEAMVVSGEDGLDEFTLTGKNFLFHLKNGKIRQEIFDAEKELNIPKVAFQEITGGSIAENVAIFRNLIEGTEKGPLKSLVCLNAAFGLLVSGKVHNIEEGYAKARLALEEGAVLQTFQNYFRSFHGPSKNILNAMIEAKKNDLENTAKKQLGFHKSRQASRGLNRFHKIIAGKEKISVIAEIKKASPSKGVLLTKDPLDLAKLYEETGAAAISVVTEKHFFSGDDRMLFLIAQNSSLPLLRKDFIIDEYQIKESKHLGADAILLIASLLPLPRLKQFLALTRELNMDAVVEVSSKEDLEKALNADAAIIGINNRDLRDFSVDLSRTTYLLPFIPKDKVIISESGFESAEQLHQFEGEIDAVLIGSSILQAQNPRLKLAEFLTSTSLC